MNDNRSLFRSQAMQRSERLEGTVVVRPPTMYRVMLALAAGTAMALTCLLFFGTYAKTLSVSGVVSLDRGIATVAAPAGVIEALYIAEGEIVSKGDRLALVVSPRTIATGDDASERIAAELSRSLELLQNQALEEKKLAEEEVAALAREDAILREESNNLATQLATANGRVVNANKRLEGAESLRLRGHMSAISLTEYEDRVLEAEGQLAALMGQRQKVLQQLHGSAIRQRQAELRAALRQKEIDRAMAEVQQRLVDAEARAGQLLRAPIAGTVTTIRYREGMQADGTAALLTIIPDGAKLNVEIYVPSVAIPYVQLGDTVSLKYRAFPHQRFGMFSGRVVQVERAAIQERGGLPAQGQSSEPVFRVLVAPVIDTVTANNRAIKLQPGMVADVHLLTQRRAIWAWLAEPFARRTAPGV
jgi:membrane fusion protein